MKPISPSEAKEQASKAIPSEVIEAVNELLVENFNARQIVIHQKDIIKRATMLMGNPHIHFDTKWLDFEDQFRANGWGVRYEGPAYCESFEAYFTFTKK